MVDGLDCIPVTTAVLRIYIYLHVTTLISLRPAGSVSSDSSSDISSPELYSCVTFLDNVFLFLMFSWSSFYEIERNYNSYYVIQVNQDKFGRFYFFI